MKHIIYLFALLAIACVSRPSAPPYYLHADTIYSWVQIRMLTDTFIPAGNESTVINVPINPPIVFEYDPRAVRWEEGETLRYADGDWNLDITQICESPGLWRPYWNDEIPMIEKAQGLWLHSPDSLPKLIFYFNITSQFIVLPGKPIEEYHVNQMVYGYSDRLVLSPETEGVAPVVCRITDWLPVNDSTIVGFAPEVKVEWQRRFGENAVRIDFLSPGNSFNMQAYEFWRDTTLIR